MSVRKEIESAESYVIEGRWATPERPPMWRTKTVPATTAASLRDRCALTDAEWEQIEALIPPAKRGGSKRTVMLREVVTGLMYVLSTGCQWRAIPSDLLLCSTLFDYSDLWNWTARSIGSMTPSMANAGRAEREASPTASVIDSRSVKSAEKGGRRDPNGYDAGKKIKGKKRHILVHTVAC